MINFVVIENFFNDIFTFISNGLNGFIALFNNLNGAIGQVSSFIADNSLVLSFINMSLDTMPSVLISTIVITLSAILLFKLVRSI